MLEAGLLDWVQPLLEVCAMQASPDVCFISVRICPTIIGHMVIGSYGDRSYGDRVIYANCKLTNVHDTAGQPRHTHSTGAWPPTYSTPARET